MTVAADGPDNGGTTPARFVEHHASGRDPHPITRATIVEAPVALEINGLAYAVMMATPADLADYALGFCLSERLIETRDQFLGCEATAVSGDPATEGGWIVRITLAGDGAGRLMDRARMRLSEGSCGLCGMDSLAEVLRPLPPVRATLDVEDAALFRAAAALRDHQPLGRATGAAHAAAFCAPDGTIRLVREDVGRHNAFDKLIGAMATAGLDPAQGFALLSARCSFELVQKAVIAGFPLLATVSAASSLALDAARGAGLRLASLLRADSVLFLPE